MKPRCEGAAGLKAERNENGFSGRSREGSGNQQCKRQLLHAFRCRSEYGVSIFHKFNFLSLFLPSLLQGILGSGQSTGRKACLRSKFATWPPTTTSATPEK